MIHVTIEDHVTERLKYLSSTTENVLQNVVEQTSDAMLPFIRQNAPVYHGLNYYGQQVTGGGLRNSLHFVVGFLGSYLAGAKQGVFVAAGTRAHTIVPRGATSIVSTHDEVAAKEYLAFWSNRRGHGVLARRVRHPGQKANDFRWNGLQQAFDEEAIQDVMDRVLQEWVSGNGA